MIRDIYINLSAMLLRFLMKTICSTINVKIYGLEDLKDNVIFAVWHQSSFLLLYANPISKTALLTATDIRGDIFTKAVEFYGFPIVRTPFRGNDKKKSAVAAIKLINYLKEGYCTVMALDGPNGPYHTIKPGAFLLSDKSGKRIVPVGIAESLRLKMFMRWDKYSIPMPFSKAVIYLKTDFDSDSAEILAKAMEETQIKAKSYLASA